MGVAKSLSVLVRHSDVSVIRHADIGMAAWEAAALQPYPVQDWQFASEEPDKCRCASPPLAKQRLEILVGLGSVAHWTAPAVALRRRSGTNEFLLEH